MKLKDISLAFGTLRELGNQKFDFLTSLAISKLIRSLELEAKLLNEKQVDLLRKHGGVEIGNGFISIPAEKTEELNAYSKAYEKLLDTEVDIEFKPLQSKILENKKMELSANDLLNLEPFIAYTDTPPKQEGKKKK